MRILGAKHARGITTRQPTKRQDFRWEIDHFVYGVNDLDTGVEWFRHHTGIAPKIGGRHEGLGTRNAIARIDVADAGKKIPPAYFEIIAPDPEQNTPPRWMGMEKATLPRMLTWAVRPVKGSRSFEEDVERSRSDVYDPGPIETYERRIVVSDAGGTHNSNKDEWIRWKLAYRHFEWPLPGNGTIPFLIGWSDEGCSHPAISSPGGCVLKAIVTRTKEPRRVEKVLGSIGGVAGVLNKTAIGDSREGVGCVLRVPGGRAVEIF